MSRVLTLCAPLVLAAPAAAAVLAPAPAAGAELVRSGGAVGGTVTYSLQGDPGEIWGLALSTNTGPTPLAIFDAGDPRVLNVGIDLISIWQLGFLDGAGQATLPLPVPPTPSLAGVPIHAQMVTVPGVGTLVDEISARNSVRLAQHESSVLTPFDNVVELNAHTATSLDDGRVLLAGGVELSGGSGTTTNAYRVFDDQAGEFTTLAATMGAARTQHTATKLADGRVLTLGGSDEAGAVHSSGEIFDPVTGTSSPIAPMSIPRVAHTATLLPDGRVFVAGGTSSFDFSDPLAAVASVTASTAIYNPTTNTWAAGPNLPKKRALHQATLTGNGQVLITGGIDVTSILFVEVPAFTTDCRRYDPVASTMSSAGSFSGARAMHGQLRLSNGNVLVAGGVDGDLITQTFTPLATVRLYNTGSNTWTSVASMAVTRVAPGLFELGGDVIAIGGLETFDLVAGTGTGADEVEVTTPAALSWTHVANLTYPRFLAAGATVSGGARILVTGSGDNGSGGAVPDLTAETYLP